MKLRSPIRLCRLLFISCVFTPAIAHAAPGDVDLSFNAGTFAHPTENPSVRALAVQADGKILVGGIFTSVNGNARNFIARLNADGLFDGSFSSPLQTFGGNSGQVLAIALQTDGKILVGGAFNINNDFTILVRLNPDGSLDNSFSVGISNNSVSTIVIQPDGKIIVGGNFGLINNTACSNIARLNTNGSLETALGNVAGIISNVDTVALQTDGKIVIGGGFIITGSTRARLTRLNSDGTQDPTFNVGDGTNGDVYALAVQPNNQILVGGFFTSINGTARNAFARLNADGSVDQAFAPTFFAGSGIYSVVLQPNGRIFIIGTFGVVNGTVRVRLARLNADGSLDSFYPTGTPSGANNTIWATVRQADNKYLVGGDFTGVAGISRANLARLLDDPPVMGNFGILQSVIAGGGGSYTGGTFEMTGTIGQSLAGVRSTGGSFAIQSGFWGGGSAVTSASPFDFDGDGKTDISIFRPAPAEWWILKSSDSGVYAAQFGAAGDVVSPGDFTGDGKADIAFFRPSAGTWFVLRSEDSSFYGFPFGSSGDVPMPADYDGDGKADAAVFRPSNAAWFILRSSDSGVTSQVFGITTDQPVAADYDGDGKADIAIYRPNGGTGGEWWILRSTAGLFAASFGSSTDKAVAGDYTGDGKADCAFYRPSTGTWYILRSEDQSFFGFPFGNSTDMPAPGDYDGDGKFDAAVYRPSNSAWFVNKSSGGVLSLVFGTTGDQPVSGAFVR